MGTLESLDGVAKGTFVRVHVAGVSPEAAAAVIARVAAYLVRHIPARDAHRSWTQCIFRGV